MPKLIGIIALSILLAGCSSPGINLIKLIDVSERVTLPATKPDTRPYVVVGIITLKGDYTTEPTDQFLRQLAEGTCKGKSTFTSQVYLNSNLEGRYSNWESVEVPNGFNAATVNGETKSVPLFKRDYRGLEFSIISHGQSARQFTIAARVPTWIANNPAKHVMVPNTITFDTWGESIDVTKSGWLLLRRYESDQTLGPGTQAIVLYLNNP